MILLTAAFILGMLACGKNGAGSGTSTAETTAADPIATALNATVSYYASHKELDDWWQVMALVSAGVDVQNEGYLPPPLNEEDVLTEGSVAAAAKAIMALYAIDADPRTYFGGGDLVQALASQQKSNGQFGSYLNEQIYAIIALECAGGEDYDRDAAYSYLCGQSLPGGGFSYDGTTVDPDLTGMALVALGFNKDNAAADATAKNAIAWLAANISENGGYPSAWENGAETSDTISTVISGLIAYGADLKAEPFSALVSSLLAYQTHDGGFSHTKQDGGVNTVSTYQALLALVSLKNGKSAYEYFKAGSENNVGVPYAYYQITGPEGDLLTGARVEVTDGISVFDGLKAVCEANGIEFESSGSGAFAYVSAIGGLKERDKGPSSGWVFAVNGVYATAGAGSTELNPDDYVWFYYSSDLGADFQAILSAE